MEPLAQHPNTLLATYEGELPKSSRDASLSEFRRSPSARLRIAYVIINANQKEGTARAVVEVAERLANEHEVRLYSRTAEDIDLSRIQWHRVPGISRPEVANFSTFLPLCTWMLRKRADNLVHSAGCNVAGADVFTIQNIQRAKSALMSQLGRDETVRMWRRFSRWLYFRVTCAAERSLYSNRVGRRTPLFLPVSRGVEAELRTHYDLGPAMVRVIPNAADAARFHPLTNEDRANWRHSHGIPEDRLLMLFAGGEWSRKGLDLAIRALAELRDKKALLFVAGDDPDRRRFEVLATELGVAERVRFGGFHRDIPMVMGAADLFLFPSRYEAFSLATIEAAACGLPVVAAKINGTEDFILTGENGAFIEHDPQHIASVLDPILADRESLRAMGRNARKHVQLHYTWDIVARRTEDAYREYLAAQ